MHQATALLLLIALVVSDAATKPAQAQGHFCWPGHGVTAGYHESLLFYYARGEFSQLEKLLDNMAANAAVVTECSNGPDERQEAVMEVAARYYSSTHEPSRAVAVIDAFLPHLAGEVEARWQAVRQVLIESGSWPPSRITEWNGTYVSDMIIDRIDQMGDFATLWRLSCGGHGEEIGLLRTKRGFQDLGIRAVTSNLPLTFLDGDGDELGERYSTLDTAATALCGAP